MNMAKTLVKFVFLLGSLFLSETAYTHICSECVDDIKFSSCKKCLIFKAKEDKSTQVLFFQCDWEFFGKTSFTDLCSICNEDNICQKCTKFAAIKDCYAGSTTQCPTTESLNTLRLDKLNDTDIANSTSNERALCPECASTTTAMKEGTEEGTTRTESPSSFETSPTITTVEVSTKEGTSRTQSTSFETSPTITTVEVSTKEGTSRTQSTSFAEVNAEEGTSGTQSSSSFENLFGCMFGAAMGGAVLGSIITAFVFTCLRRRTARQKIRESESDALQNLAKGYGMEQLGQDQDIKTRVICNEINNETGQETSAEFEPDEERVYNHLNATETIDRDEYYDHTRTGPAFKTQSDTNNDDYDHAGPVPSTALAYDDYGI